MISLSKYICNKCNKIYKNNYIIYQQPIYNFSITFQQPKYKPINPLICRYCYKNNNNNNNTTKKESIIKNNIQENKIGNKSNYIEKN